MPRAHKSLSLVVEALAAGGDGVAHVEHQGERRAVFLPRTAPGDQVRAEVDFSLRTARATQVAIVHRSEARVVPPCPVVERCGGCDWMHVAPDAQRQAHADIVRAALARVTAVPPVAAHAPPATERYRTRARLLVEAKRGGVEVGFRQAKSRHLASIARCLVLDERLDRALPLLLTLFEGEAGQGDVHIALAPAGRLVFSLAWQGNLAGTFFSRVEGLTKAGVIAGAEVTLAGASRPATIGDATAETVGGDGEPLLVPAASFAQANPAVSRQLTRRALELLDPQGTDVVELFSGAGNFTVALSRVARSVVAVEADRRAVAAARSNLAARGLEASLVEADADGFSLPPGVTRVLLDPPRAGAAGAVARIAASRIGRVVYVSCDPATLARDVGVLVHAGFTLDAVETFEMFPHTSHVESLVLLSRTPAARAKAGSS